VRVFIGLAIFAVLVTLGFRAFDRTAGEAGDAAGRSMNLPSGTPPELAGVFASLEHARNDALGKVGGFLPGRKGKGQAAPATAQPEPPFADAGPPRRIAAVKRAVRRTLARGEQRRRVLAWQGVIVSGSRAVARADLEEAVEMTSGSRMNRAAGRVTLGLIADGGWQVVTVE
jgi:hypothetical protein